MEINRKQFLGSLLAGATVGCIPAFASPKLDKPTEFEKCRNDILYFVDNYLEVNDRLYGKLKMSPQQREYLKRISTAPDYFFCAKGRQIGISTANNVFAYWKTTCFGPDHHVFIVEPNIRMCEYAQNNRKVSNSGAFMPHPNCVHFVTPDRIEHGVDWHNCNNTYILDEYDWWKNMVDTSIAYEILLRMNYSRCLERGQSLDGFDGKYSPIIISGTPKNEDTCNFVFCNLKYFLHDSRYMVLPSPTGGLKA